MGGKTAETPSKCGITSGIEKGTLVSKTITYIWQQLHVWRDDLNRPDEQSENKLNLQLVKFLDARARTEFPMVRFDHEEYQYERRSVDISASPVERIEIGARLHTIYDPILVIEGKRMPMPSPDREQEYVTGGKDRASGGIQRFKLGLHGGNLSTAAMVGYVQERPLTYWHNQINEWIAKLANGVLEDSCDWHNGEKLSPLEEDSLTGVARSRSDHPRIGRVKSRRIEIHHLWVGMKRGNRDE